MSVRQAIVDAYAQALEAGRRGTDIALANGLTRTLTHDFAGRVFVWRSSDLQKTEKFYISIYDDDSPVDTERSETNRLAKMLSMRVEAIFSSALSDRDCRDVLADISIIIGKLIDDTNKKNGGVLPPEVRQVIFEDSTLTVKHEQKRVAACQMLTTVEYTTLLWGE